MPAFSNTKDKIANIAIRVSTLFFFMKSIKSINNMSIKFIFKVDYNNYERKNLFSR